MLDKVFAFLQSEQAYVRRMPERHHHHVLFDAAMAEITAMRTLPTIVCICGSGRFQADILAASENLTLSGCIVLAPNVFPREENQFDKPGRLVTDNEKGLLDVLHFRKIDLSARVHVVNTGGYIGESVHKEVTYALRMKKKVTFKEPKVVPWNTRHKEPVSTRHYLQAVRERLALEDSL